VALSSGSKLGPYEILAPLGAGGMGEVYRAKDTRLGRTVAVKVLPAHLSRSPNLRKRLEREAQAISSLSHPHICTLHDVGQHLGVDFLVMEYLEGETLAQRLRKGHLPLDQALRHATEIADALDKAHRQGVIHRDLKPGNIMLTKSGAKLLDFGLAKLRGTGVDEEASRASALPTEDRPLTEEGTILGTYPYMSPEQLEGKEADARTDIFAFGTVLYEMVTGKRAFVGKSRASLIAAIMSSEPCPMSELQPLTPSAVDHLVTACLAKDPEERWQSARDLMLELLWIAEGSTGAVVSMPVAVAQRSHWRRALTVSLVVLGVTVVTGMAVWNLMRPGPRAPQPLKRFAISLPPNVTLPQESGRLLALSPDGTKLAFVGFRGGVFQLFLRSMDHRAARAIPGTEGAHAPAFSPDGETVAFDVRGQPFKVSLAGRPPVALAEAGTYPTWSPDGSLFFWRSGLWRVPAGGGEPQAVNPARAKPYASFGRPKVLPNGKAVLFEGFDESRMSGTIEVLSLETGEQRSLVTRGTSPLYVPVGHILFARSGSLFAVAFDAERLRVTGPAVPVLPDLRIEEGGAAQFTVGSDGSLVYAKESTSAPDGTLVWVDRQGEARAITERRHRFRDPRLSPDGRRVAVGITGPGGSDIWLHGIDRDVLTRLTFEGSSSSPIWSPEGMRLAFTRGYRVFVKSAGGGGEAEQLTAGRPYSWSSDGSMMIRTAYHGKTGEDIVLVRLDGDGKPETLVGSRFDEIQATLSPDDRLLAFTSDETGRSEVFVASFPNTSRKWQVSTEGGREPMWARDGSELFFRDGDKMLSVGIRMGPELALGKPVLLFEGRYARGGEVANYDVAPNGEGFIMIRHEGGGTTPVELEVVLNWFDELERLAPPN